MHGYVLHVRECNLYCHYMRSSKDEGLQPLKFYFPWKKGERAVFNSFFTEYNLY